MAIQTVHEAAGDERGERTRAFTLPLDIPLLEEAIARVGARLVVIDPLMAYLDGRINSWRDQDVRATLAPLARLGEKTGAAILILRHLTKGGGANALYRGGGSIGIIGAARSGLVVAKNPDNPEQERILASSKSNLGPPMPSLRYRLAAPPPEDTTRDPTPRAEWLGASEHTAATLLASPANPSAPVERTVVEEACVFLQELLREGARPAADAQRAALAAGFSQATIKRARAKVGVEARLVGFRPGAQWVWDWVRDDGGDVP
jgi:AAA domain